MTIDEMKAQGYFKKQDSIEKADYSKSFNAQSSTIMEFFNQIKEEVKMMVIATAPNRSGILSESFKIEPYEDGFAIRTTATEDFNYMQYVEDMAVHGKYGWINYNYKWLQKLAEMIAQRLAERLGGTVHVG